MSRTWRPRKKRRGAVHGAGQRELTVLRLCCRTTSRQNHAPGCVRHPVMCGVKRGFETATGARRRVRHLSRETPDLLWREYECPECGLWHRRRRSERRMRGGGRPMGLDVSARQADERPDRRRGAPSAAGRGQGVVVAEPQPGVLVGRVGGDGPTAQPPRSGGDGARFGDPPQVAAVATCRRCGNPIERQADGGWGTAVRMRTGCYHVPVKDSVRPATPPASGQEPHPHFHSHGGQRHAHAHVHVPLEPGRAVFYHEHSSLTAWRPA